MALPASPTGQKGAFASVNKMTKYLKTRRELRQSEKYADVLFALVKEHAKRTAHECTFDDPDPDMDLKVFRLALESCWPKVCESFLSPLTSDEKRELTDFALTMPSSGLTGDELKRIKQEYGEQDAYTVGAECWTEALFKFYCDTIVKDMSQQLR